MNCVMEDPIINGKVLEDNCFFEDTHCLVEQLGTIDDNGVWEQGECLSILGNHSGCVNRMLGTKVGKYRDTVSVDPGSRPFCGSVSVSTSQFWGIASRNDSFLYNSDTLDVSFEIETKSVSMSPTHIFCIGNNLVGNNVNL